MSTNSGIEWTEATWNPLSGCTRHSPGCQHCYAEKITKRLAAMGQEKYQGLLDKNGRFNGKINLDEDALRIPLRRRKPTVYFVNSMSDLFHENVPDTFIDKVWWTMMSEHARKHRFVILTKRADRMHEYVKYRVERLGYSVLPNVILGVSAENQKYADERIPLLLQTPAACRMVSAEPLLGPIDMLNDVPYLVSGYLDPPFDDRIDWVVCGGESGPGARPCEITWIRDIVRQCKDAGVACFVKQLGANCDIPLRHQKGADVNEWPADLRVRAVPEVLAR